MQCVQVLYLGIWGYFWGWFSVELAIEAIGYCFLQKIEQKCHHQYGAFAGFVGEEQDSKYWDYLRRILHQLKQSSAIGCDSLHHNKQLIANIHNKIENKSKPKIAITFNPIKIILLICRNLNLAFLPLQHSICSPWSLPNNETVASIAKTNLKINLAKTDSFHSPAQPASKNIEDYLA